MQSLYITHAEQRRLHGSDSYSLPSRFIREIPDECIEEIRPKVQVSRPLRSPERRPAARAAEPETGIRLGQHVRHETGLSPGICSVQQ